MSGVLECAMDEWGWTDQKPTKKVKNPRKPQPRDRRISDGEIERVLSALDFGKDGVAKNVRLEIAVAFLLAIETAMRQGELWGLKWDRVNLEKQFVRLPITKNGYRRDVALSSRAVELFGYLKPKKSGTGLAREMRKP